MYIQEMAPHPTGRFPSVEEESVMRADFLYTANNPLYDYFLSNLEYSGFGDLSSYVAMNFLALNYGLSFYNIVSDYSLYSPDDYPKFRLVADKRFPTTFGIVGSDIAYVNIQGSDFRDQYMHDPSGNLALFEEPKVEFPTFIVHILAGIEEASHIHLKKLQEAHGANSNSQNDNDNPDLWKAGVATFIEYQSQRWREFAAVTVQRAYIQYYLSGDYPVEAVEFESHYKQVKRAREQWNSQSR